MRGLRLARAGFLWLCVPALFSCDSPNLHEPTASDAKEDRPQGSAAELASNELQYLPYGVPIDPAAIGSRVPEPYDPRKHGAPLDNTMPHANLAGTAVAKSPRDRVQRLEQRSREWVDLTRCSPGTGCPSNPPLPAGDGDAGWFVSLAGIYARNDAQRNVSLSSKDVDQYLYAPTHYPSKFSCVEVTTVHHRAANASSTRHFLGWLDWCEQIDFKVFEEMDATWRSKYIVTAGGPASGDPSEEIFIVMVRNTQQSPTGACWEGLIYNWPLAMWESKTSGSWCGTVQRQFGSGWTIWESYDILPASGSDCPGIPGIRATLLSKYQSNGSWALLQPADIITQLSPGSCWSFEYEFHEHAWAPGTQNPANFRSYWHGHTPNAN